MDIIENTTDKVFTYGQAQKWVNMTLKYMYILGFLNEDIASKLHVPIDSYILKAASLNKEETHCLGNENIIPKDHSDDSPAVSFGPYRDSGKNKSRPWSKFNEEDYKKFQEALRNNINEKFPDLIPIDWEGNGWIEIAKNTK